jgi:acetyl-CoA carboxylase biotin carboxylase subunit
MQILMALGERLKKVQPKPQWHAIECRINAEDPEHDFRPCPGKIADIHFPGGLGIRVDSHAYSGYEIPPYYDSLVGKLIVRAKTRPEAISRMRHALDEFVIEGIKTTIPFHKKLMESEKFQRGEFDTRFLDTFDYKEADHQPINESQRAQ